MNRGAQEPDERPARRREYSGAASTLGLAALLVAVLGLAVWYFEVRGSGGGGRTGDAELGIVALPEALNPTGEEPAAQVGRPAPNFRLLDVHGEERSLTDFRGTTVVLNFWATWCGPCRSETPELQRYYEDADGELVVLGVNQQEGRETARDFLQEFGVTYPVVLDSDGEVSQGYRVGRGLPVTMVIDGEGIIQAVHIGQVDAVQLDGYLARAPQR